MSLRGKLVRLAHSNPELRPKILPVLKKARGTVVRKRGFVVLEAGDFKNKMIWQGILHDFDIPMDPALGLTVTLSVSQVEYE